jgi:hypothetical protein
MHDPTAVDHAMPSVTLSRRVLHLGGYDPMPASVFHARFQREYDCRAAVFLFQTPGNNTDDALIPTLAEKCEYLRIRLRR